MAISKNPTFQSSIRGLQLRNGSFFLRRMINRVTIQQTLGRVDEMSVKEAEQVAINLIDEVREKGDFALQTRQKFKKIAGRQYGNNKPQTIKEISDELIDIGERFGTKKTGGRPWKKSQVTNWRYWQTSERMKILIDQPITNLTSSIIEDWYLSDLQLGHKSATDNAFRQLRRVFKMAISRQYISEDVTEAVANGEMRYTVPRRSGRLRIDHGELGRFAMALASYRGKQCKETNRTIRDVILVALLSGRRIKEIKNLEWSWINLERRIITFPGEANPDELSSFEGVKNRRDFELPLPRILVTMLRDRFERQEMLAEQHGHNARERFVFIGKGGNRPIQDISSTFNSIVTQAGLESLKVHDLRRTFADIVYRTKRDFYATQQMMGHSRHSITAQYMDELDLVEKRKTIQKVSDFVSQSMPVEGLEISGVAIKASGLEDLDEDGTSSTDERVFMPNGLEYLMFPKRVWRKNQWWEHGGIDDALDLRSAYETAENLCRLT